MLLLHHCINEDPAVTPVQSLCVCVCTLKLFLMFSLSSKFPFKTINIILFERVVPPSNIHLTTCVS